MRYSPQLKTIFQIFVAFLWAGAAYAAPKNLAESIQEISLDSFGWAVLLSGGAGFVATVNKVADAIVPQRNAYFVMFKDVLVSLFTGLITFGMATWWGVAGGIQVFVIPLMGYAGSRALEKGIQNGLFPIMDRVFDALGALIGLRSKDKETP